MVVNEIFISQPFVRVKLGVLLSLQSLLLPTMKKILFLVAVFSAVTLSTFSQVGFRYKTDFGFLFDNLEGSLPYAPTRTIAGINLTPAVGFNYKNHSLMVGAAMFEQFGTPKVIDNVDFQAYYQYKDDRFMAAVGAFPRNMLKKYPLAFFTTSKEFMDNTITGGVGQYSTKNGYIELFFDWYKSDIVKGVDRFIVAAAGERWFGGTYTNGNIMYNHVADQPYFDDFTVFDRLQFNLNVGYDFARHQSVFDEIKFSIGALGDIERRRNSVNKGFESAVGFQSEQTLSWKGLALYNNIYYGKAQMMYAPVYGTDIYFGSPFYQSKFQDNLMVSYAHKYRWLTLKATMAFYFTEQTIGNQQIISVDFNIDDIFKFKKK